MENLESRDTGELRRFLSNNIFFQRDHEWTVDDICVHLEYSRRSRFYEIYMNTKGYFPSLLEYLNQNPNALKVALSHDRLERIRLDVPSDITDDDIDDVFERLACCTEGIPLIEEIEINNLAITSTRLYTGCAKLLRSRVKRFRLDCIGMTWDGLRTFEAAQHDMRDSVIDHPSLAAVDVSFQFVVAEDGPGQGTTIPLVGYLHTMPNLQRYSFTSNRYLQIEGGSLHGLQFPERFQLSLHGVNLSLVVDDICKALGHPSLPLNVHVSFDDNHPALRGDCAARRFYFYLEPNDYLWPANVIFSRFFRVSEITLVFPYHHAEFESWSVICSGVVKSTSLKRIKTEWIEGEKLTQLVRELNHRSAYLQELTVSSINGNKDDILSALFIVLSLTNKQSNTRILKVNLTDIDFRPGPYFQNGKDILELMKDNYSVTKIELTYALKNKGHAFEGIEAHIMMMAKMNQDGRYYLMNQRYDIAAGVKFLASLGDDLDCIYYHLRNDNPDLLFKLCASDAA